MGPPFTWMETLASGSFFSLVTLPVSLASCAFDDDEISKMNNGMSKLLCILEVSAKNLLQCYPRVTAVLTKYEANVTAILPIGNVDGQP